MLDKLRVAARIRGECRNEEREVRGRTVDSGDHFFLLKSSRQPQGQGRSTLTVKLNGTLQGCGALLVRSLPKGGAEA